MMIFSMIKALNIATERRAPLYRNEDIMAIVCATTLNSTNGSQLLIIPAENAKSPLMIAQANRDTLMEVQ